MDEERGTDSHRRSRTQTDSKGTVDFETGGRGRNSLRLREGLFSVKLIEGAVSDLSGLVKVFVYSPVSKQTLSLSYHTFLKFCSVGRPRGTWADFESRGSENSL